MEEKSFTTEKPDLRRWDRLDSLRLCDAAHLWVDEMPLVTPDITPRALPVWMWLQKAAMEGRLLVVTAQMTPHDKFPYVWASRSNLRAFAEQNGERPTFLFPEDKVRAVDAQG